VTQAAFDAGLHEPNAIRATLARGSTENSEHGNSVMGSHSEVIIDPISKNYLIDRCANSKRYTRSSSKLQTTKGEKHVNGN